jgi:hypothetical protein
MKTTFFILESHDILYLILDKIQENLLEHKTSAQIGSLFQVTSYEGMNCSLKRSQNSSNKLSEGVQ